MKKLTRSFIDGWNNFFFKPISPATLGFFRICFGFIIFLAVLGRYPFRELFYGINGIISSEMTAPHFPGNPIFYFRWVPETDPWLKYYFLAILLSTVSLIVGYRTKLSSILVFIGLTSLSNRNFYIDNAGDDLMRINCFFMMFAPLGAAYSIDRWLKVRNGKEKGKLKPINPWAQRLLQLQLAYVYVDTVWLKLPGEGWRNGTALYYALNYIELQRFSFKYFFYYLWQIKLATWGVMIAETSMFTLVWFRKLRYWILGAAFMLHLGINLTMQFPIFQYVMMTSLINFVYPEDVERLISNLKLKIKKLVNSF